MQVRSADARNHQFNFYDVAEAAGLAGRNIPEQMIVDHMDPFYAECRAYGRMEERECNGVVAVRCHGFTSVPADREREISEAFDIMDWNRPSDEYDRSISERQPLRAIVKDLRREEICFTKTMVRRMKADLFKLRKILVFVRDIRSDNYLGGKLLDFSVAWTEPHLMLSTDVQSQAAIDIEVTSELHEFDEMVREEGINSKVRAVPAGTGQNIDQLRRSKRIRVNPQRYTDPPRETQVARINRRKHHKSKAKA